MSATTRRFGRICLPYLDGPKLELLEESQGATRFLWLLPLTKEEVSFKKANGLEALEEQLELHQLDYVDPGRDSVV